MLFDSRQLSTLRLCQSTPLGTLLRNALPVDRMQLVDVSGAHWLGRRTFAGKGSRHIHYRGALPSPDLHWMHSMLL